MGKNWNIECFLKHYQKEVEYLFTPLIIDINNNNNNNS